MRSNPSPEETWSWDGTNWSQLATIGAPSEHGSYLSSIAYDAARKSTVFFGHTNSGSPTTWTFDGKNWKQASTSGSASARFAMARDDFTSTIVLYGENGDTWTWDGSSWTPANPVHSPGRRYGMSMTYDSTHHVVALFGGAVGNFPTIAQAHNDIWNWDGTDWTKVSGN